jgi:TonB family protein
MNSMPFSFSRALLALLFCIFTASLALAQSDPAPGISPDDISVKPIYVSTRIFQVRAKQGSYEELSNQVFRLKTASLDEHEKWIRAFGKTYPGFEAALLRTEEKRVFRSARPTNLSLVKQADGRTIEVQIFGAQSPGDGSKPGTTLIPEVALHFGNDRVMKPVTYAIQPIEIDSGMTYYFATNLMKLNAADYVKFVRPNTPAEAFEGIDTFLVFAFSVELEKPAQPARYFDERQSLELQEKAAKKPRPEVSAALRDAGLGGLVRVRVEISADGKVSAAGIHASTFPEMNADVLAAARGWEFSPALFAENKTPITGFLLFNFPAQPPAKKESPANPAKQ